ncbi:hypothetical protein BJV82DRAFT_623331 [Fennellomyces sp. T-0311]|nr:hypothetical protein BJV82DRAFT_623331 [Fennellomyces sp. T-0311]
MVVPSDSSDDDLESRPDTFTDQSSVQEPRQPIRRNQLTASTRRQSFAQKYGLNSQQNRSSLHPMQGRQLTDDFDESDEEDSEDDRPLQPLPEPTQKLEYPTPAMQQRAGGMARPISVCNIAEASSPARPSRFVKPATQAVRHVEVPSDMQSVQRLSENFNNKVYMEGYLAKMNDLAVDGRTCTDRRWAEHYVELCGPVLTLWNTETSSERSFPEYINVTDSLVDLVDQDNRQFILNSAGENRYIFQSNDANAQTWALAIRLACFECSRIHEIYTRRFVSRYSESLIKRSPKVEGWLQVRFPGQREWKKYWTVVTDRRTEKRLFGKKSVPTRGQLMFYESKKAKLPVKTIVNVVQAYTIYPESPQLIDLATMMKVEGNIYDNKSDKEQKVTRAAASTLLVAANPRELSQWLVGTFDAFKLYGRPSKLLDEPADSNALNFGEPRYGKNLPRLFLEVVEAQSVNVRGETLLDNKLAFAHILEQKLRQQLSVPAPNTAGVMGSRTNSMPLISGFPTSPGAPQEEVTRRPQSNTMPPPQTHRHSAPLLQQVAPSHSMQTQQPPNSRRSTSNLSLMAANRQQHQVYASDDSDSDEDASEDDDDDDTESTSSIYEKTIPVSKPITTAATATPATTTPTLAKASPPNSSQKSPSPPQNSARRPSAMTLPEISESNDFISSILGDMSLDSKSNQANPGPPPPPPAHITPIASASTPVLQLSSQQLRDNPKYQNNSSSSDSSVASSGKNIAVSPPSQPVSKQRPASAMAWRRSSSNLLMRPQSSSSGSGSSVSMAPSVSESSSMGHQPHQQHRAAVQPQARAPPENNNRRSMVYMNDNGGRRSSSAILLQQHWEAPEEEHDHYAMHHHPPPQHHQGYPQHDPYYQQQQGHYYADGHETDDDAPIIPQLGTNFVTQNSLLDMYQSDQLPARIQEENARMAGQPLVNLPNKPPQPRAGLVGMISQLEHDKRERDSVKGRLLEMEKERALEQERERFHLDQQQQQQRHSHMMQQQSSPSPVASQVRKRAIVCFLGNSYI